MRWTTCWPAAGEVNAVDVNPIQNALLELKVAAIARPGLRVVLRPVRPGPCRRMPGRCTTMRCARNCRRWPSSYWDKHIGFFPGKGWRKSFYYRGTSGLLAKLVLVNARVLHRLRDADRRHCSPPRRWRNSAPSTSADSAPHLDAVAALVPGATRHLDPAGRALAAARPDRPPVSRQVIALHPRLRWRPSSASCRSATITSGASTSRDTTRPIAARNISSPTTSLRLKGGLALGCTIHTATVTDFLRRTRPSCRSSCCWTTWTG